MSSEVDMDVDETSGVSIETLEQKVGEKEELFMTLIVDDHKVVVSEKYINMSKTLSDMIEDTGGFGNIKELPLENCSKEILDKVLDFCKLHSEEPRDYIEGQYVEGWPKEFLEMDITLLYELTLVANYLNIEALSTLCCRGVAELIKGKAPSEIKIIYEGKPEDFTEEEIADAWENHPKIMNDAKINGIIT